MSLRSQAASRGEWERDANGKRFRRVGNSIEYEMMIHTSSGVIPESELEDFNRRQREECERRAAEAATAPTREITFCPLAMLRASVSDKCMKEECAFYGEHGCMMANEDAAIDTAGLLCPVAGSGRKCFNRCELYKNGCTLTAVARKRSK